MGRIKSRTMTGVAALFFLLAPYAIDPQVSLIHQPIRRSSHVPSFPSLKPGSRPTDFAVVAGRRVPVLSIGLLRERRIHPCSTVLPAGTVKARSRASYRIRRVSKAVATSFTGLTSYP